MPRIQFPNVPNVAGVPNLVRSVNVQPETVQRLALGAAQAAIWSALQQGTSWGIFETGTKTPIYSASPFGTSGVVATILSTFGGPTLSFHSLAYTKECKTSDFPVESGGFASYNKVEMPGQPTVTLAFTGTEPQRKAFQDAIRSAIVSTKLYDVVTPEQVFKSHSIDSMKFERRADHGATLLFVTFGLREVRQVQAVRTTTSITTASQSSSAKPADTAGRVQQKTPAPSIAKIVVEKLTGLFK